MSVTAKDVERHRKCCVHYNGIKWCDTCRASVMLVHLKFQHIVESNYTEDEQEMYRTMAESSML